MHTLNKALLQNNFTEKQKLRSIAKVDIKKIFTALLPHVTSTSERTRNEPYLPPPNKLKMLYKDKSRRSSIVQNHLQKLK